MNDSRLSAPVISHNSCNIIESIKQVQLLRNVFPEKPATEAQYISLYVT